MSKNYVPQVGHKVRLPTWYSYEWVDVLAVGEHRFFGRLSNGEEGSYHFSNPGVWVQVVDPKPLPYRWLNVHPGWVSSEFRSREAADEFATPDRIAVLHIWTDEHGDHAGIERVEP